MARPPFEPTDEQRRRVSIAAGGGMSHEEIALAIGISKPTLEKYFEAELSTAAYERRIEVLEAMHSAALKGNVTAQKAYLSIEPALAAPPAEPEKAEKIGKKEKADRDARVAHLGDPEWSVLLAPASVQ